MGERHRDICFTSFKTEKPRWHDTLTYLVFQREKCPTTGKEHWQGFAQAKNPKASFKAWQKCLAIGAAHCEPRWGTATQARDYCMATEWPDKETKEMKPKGQIPGTTEQIGEFDPKESDGKRNDLLEVKRKIDNGVSCEELVEDDDHFGTFAAHSKFFNSYQSAKRRRKGYCPPIVEVIYGETGTNKSRRVWEKYDYDTGKLWKLSPDMASGQTVWFDGYAGHEAVLIEEFRPGMMKYNALLDILDGYPTMVQVKGGSVHWSPTHIYITSPVAPEEWYPNLAANDKIAQLKRRITTVTCTSLTTDEEMPQFPAN